MRNPGSNPRLVEDCIALVAVRNHFKSIPANAGLEWNTPWQGIRVNPDGRRVLDLSDNNLSGTIPPQLGNLTNLQNLLLHDNNLSGAIPPELGNLTNLVYLRLSGNNLSGAIPPELGNLTNLRALRLEDNNLSGTIPTELGKLANLRVLILYHNDLSGTIPPELGFTKLEFLRLYGNSLSGAIPPELGNLTNLKFLRLSGNNLSGAIPAELGNLTNLKFLRLGNNNLSGEIPPELGNLINLQELHLATNELSGTIPAELGNLTNLQNLFIHDNRLSGEIPDTLKVSHSFGFCNNQLTGALPPQLHHTGYGGDVNDISDCWEGTFRDDDDNSHRRDIEQIAAWGITQGCDGQDRFCPSRTVNRAQMAAFLHRAAAHLHGQPDPAEEVQFTDVDPDAWYLPHARWAAANGVMRAPDGAFNPHGPVTRADMAEMLIAAFDHLTASPQIKGLFTDVAAIPPAAIQAIEAIHNAGITRGCATAPLRYCPTQEVTRAQMSSFLVRALNQADNDS